MQLAIAIETGYLRAELAGRRSAEETRQVLEEVIAASRRQRLYCVLAVVRASTPIFKVGLRGSADRRYRFTRVVIAGAPAEPGVYTLWQNDEVIYYGRAQGEATLRSRLLEQLAAGVPATHYGWEISREPASRELELLQQFRQAFGRLPRLNQAA